MSHPYADGESHQFWNRAMSAVAPGHVDPVTPGLRIGAEERVATLGSCFAQHIARHLQRSGCTYHVTESAPEGMSAEAAQARQYGLFSARYGNVYTVRQALQLFDRAYGRFRPRARAWPRGDGFVDPFRPQVEPEGFRSEAEVLQSRDAHLACVRTMFETSAWLVFTLGLTEAWRDREDGAVFPLAPGVAGGRYDATQTEFVNFDIDAVRSDLAALIERVRVVNPACRWVLTVSPVPLAATFEPRHVWVSTVASKAVLRVAADEAQRRFDHVHYFPSYEVITSPAAGNRYYADDLRQVTDIGVQHVMRLFSQHCLQPTGGHRTRTPPAALHLPGAGDVVCDEEAITAAMNALGPRGAA